MADFYTRGNRDALELLRELIARVERGEMCIIDMDVRSTAEFDNALTITGRAVPIASKPPGLEFNINVENRATPMTATQVMQAAERTRREVVSPDPMADALLDYYGRDAEIDYDAATGSYFVVLDGRRIKVPPLTISGFRDGVRPPTPPKDPTPVGASAAREIDIT